MTSASGHKQIPSSAGGVPTFRGPPLNGSAGGKPQRTLWELSAETTPDAADRYRAAVAHLFHIELDGADADFRNRLEGYDLGELAMGRCQGVAQTFIRTRTQAHRGVDHVQVILQLSDSAWTGDYDGRRIDHSMGRLRIVDMARPFEAHGADFETLNLMIPRARLGEVADHDVHGMVVAETDPGARLLFAHMLGLWEQLPGMKMEQAVAGARALIALLAGVIAGAARDRPSESRPLERTLFGRARDHIDANLGDVNLTPESLRLHLGVSRPMLYRILAPAGGVSSFIQTRRLDHAFDAVAAASRTNLSLAQIAFAHGFRSDAHFSRAFRKRFGMSPGELKAVERRGSPPPPLAADDVERVFDWFRRL